MNRLLLLGAGFGNLELIKNINMRKLKDFSVTLVNPERFQVNPGLISDYLEDIREFKDISVDLRNYCSLMNAELIEDKVTGINSELRYADLLKTGKREFDTLVINTGSIPAPLPGEEIRYIRPLMKAVDFKIDITNCPNSSVTIVGSGSKAAETALSIAELSRRRNLGLKVSLVFKDKFPAGDLLINGQKIIEKELLNKNVVLYKERTVSKIKDNILYLTDGTVIYSDFILGAELPGVHGLNLKGFGMKGKKIETDRFLRADGISGIYSLGDMTLPDGKWVPGGLSNILRQTEVIKENILREIKGIPLVPFTPGRSGLKMISLTGERAYIEFFGMDFSGKMAGKIKRYIDRKYLEKRFSADNL